MFRVQDVILSEDIATAKFACDVTRCKGACCVVGDSGAPVDKEEIPAIRKAYNLLADELRPEAVEAVKKLGLIRKNSTDSLEITCVDEKECVFVIYSDDGVATCAIQKAFYEGKTNWEKPVSCHLFPVRLKRIAGMDFANFEYVPSLCSAGCENGNKKGIYLAEFLKNALTRRYGAEWYEEFENSCREVRDEEAQHA